MFLRDYSVGLAINYTLIYKKKQQQHHLMLFYLFGFPCL